MQNAHLFPKRTSILVLVCRPHTIALLHGVVSGTSAIRLNFLTYHNPRCAARQLRSSSHHLATAVPPRQSFPPPQPQSTENSYNVSDPAPLCRVHSRPHVYTLMAVERQDDIRKAYGKFAMRHIVHIQGASVIVRSTCCHPHCLVPTGPSSSIAATASGF